MDCYSLDTLNAEKSACITRRGTLSTAPESSESGIDAGVDRIKINPVLTGGFNDNEVTALADLTVKYPADVCFIELMPMGEQGEFGQNAMIPCQQILMRFPNLHHGR